MLAMEAFTQIPYIVPREQPDVQTLECLNPWVTRTREPHGVSPFSRDQGR